MGISFITIFRHAAFCIAGLLVAFTVAVNPIQAAATGSFSRGIAIAHALGWAEAKPAPTTEFIFPPFQDVSRALSRDELIAMRGAGFDFVRLAVDPGPFLQFKGTRRDTLDTILTDHVRQILSCGLSVVVDFHPSDLNASYASRALTAGVRTPLFQAYVGLLGRTAALLASVDPARVAIEIMNEPPIRTAAWQPMLEAGYAAIRAQAPALPIIVSGGDEGSADGLMQIAPGVLGGDPGVLFSFHFYDPYQFTHQGASWNAARHLAGVPYPADARPLEASVRATGDAIEASHLPPEEKKSAYFGALKQLASYRHSGFGRAAIANTFDRLARWARDRRIPANRILLGEFGAMNPARDGPAKQERAHWFRDVREEAERHSFGWAVWVYRGSGGFALVDPESNATLDPSIIAALGLEQLPGDSQLRD